MRFHYETNIIQQPLQARAMGWGLKADSRRPVDPPPVIEFKVKDSDGNDVSHSLTMNFLVHASLVEAEDSLNNPNGTSPVPSNRLVGTTIVALSHIRSPAPGKCLFLLNDLSIRQEGRYRLVFKIYQFNIDEARVQFIAQQITNTITVYSPKTFPGLKSSSDLIKEMASQGCKVRVRKDSTCRKKKNSVASRESPPFEGNTTHPMTGSMPSIAARPPYQLQPQSQVLSQLQPQRDQQHQQHQQQPQPSQMLLSSPFDSCYNSNFDTGISKRPYYPNYSGASCISKDPIAANSLLSPPRETFSNNNVVNRQQQNQTYPYLTGPAMTQATAANYRYPPSQYPLVPQQQQQVQYKNIWGHQGCPPSSIPMTGPFVNPTPNPYMSSGPSSPSRYKQQPNQRHQLTSYYAFNTTAPSLGQIPQPASPLSSSSATAPSSSSSSSSSSCASSASQSAFSNTEYPAAYASATMQSAGSSVVASNAQAECKSESSDNYSFPLDATSKSHEQSRFLLGSSSNHVNEFTQDRQQSYAISNHHATTPMTFSSRGPSISSTTPQVLATHTMPMTPSASISSESGTWSDPRSSTESCQTESVCNAYPSQPGAMEPTYSTGPAPSVSRPGAFDYCIKPEQTYAEIHL